MKRLFAAGNEYVGNDGARLVPWLLIANFVLLLYLVSVAQDARDAAWEAESSASEAADKSYGDRLDAIESTLESVGTDVSRLRSEVSSLNTTMMFRR